MTSRRRKNPWWKCRQFALLSLLLLFSSFFSRVNYGRANRRRGEKSRLSKRGFLQLDSTRNFDIRNRNCLLCEGREKKVAKMKKKIAQSTLAKCRPSWKTGRRDFIKSTLRRTEPFFSILRERRRCTFFPPVVGGGKSWQWITSEGRCVCLSLPNPFDSNRPEGPEGRTALELVDGPSVLPSFLPQELPKKVFTKTVFFLKPFFPFRIFDLQRRLLTFFDPPEARKRKCNFCGNHFSFLCPHLNGSRAKKSRSRSVGRSVPLLSRRNCLFIQNHEKNLFSLSYTRKESCSDLFGIKSFSCDILL